MTAFKSTPEWAFGEGGELQVRRLYIEQGFYVIDTRSIEAGGAPALIGQLERHVLPDLMATAEGSTRWVEVKSKDSPTKFQKANEWRHGIDAHHWDAYREVERQTGIPGMLAIYEWRRYPGGPASPRVLQATFDLLAARIVQRAKPGVITGFKYGAVMWRRETFDEFALDGPIPDLRPSRTSAHPWEQAGKDGQAPKPNPDEQLGLFRVPAPCVGSGRAAGRLMDKHSMEPRAKCTECGQFVAVLAALDGGPGGVLDDHEAG